MMCAHSATPSFTAAAQLVVIAPRPFGQALHASLPNEIIHFDFLYMGPSKAGYKYLLLIKDDLSGYLWLVPCLAADAATTIDALMKWFSSFGVAQTWVSIVDPTSKTASLTACGKPYAHNITSPPRIRPGRTERWSEHVAKSCVKLVPSS
jgi:hypothetical protein